MRFFWDIVDWFGKLIDNCGLMPPPLLIYDETTGKLYYRIQDEYTRRHQYVEIEAVWEKVDDVWIKRGVMCRGNANAPDSI